LAERLGYDTVCIDDLVAAVRAVTTVVSHPKIHAMTGIDYREYYIRNAAETLCRHAMDAQPQFGRPSSRLREPGPAGARRR